MDTKRAEGKQKAYALLNVKAIEDSESQWTITGMASTPTPDRMEDIVDPMGAQFKLPLPLLWQHESDKPIGNVTLAKPTKKGIPFTAVIPKVLEPGALQDRINEAVQSIKYKLVAAVSIGFRVLDSAIEFLESGGLKFSKWEWLELSVVTIPANAEAIISQIKAYDDKRAALGQHRVVRVSPLGDSGKTTTPTTKKGDKMATKSIADQLTEFRKTRDAKRDQARELLAKSGNDGSTMEPSDEAAYEELIADIETLDKHIDRLDKSLKILGDESTPAPSTSVEDGAAAAAAAAAQARGAAAPRVVATAKKLPKGVQFARLAKLMAMADGDSRYAFDIAKDIYPEEKPLHDVLKMHVQMHVGKGQSSAFIQKATVDAAITTTSAWAGALVQYQDIATDFLEFLRPLTIVDRLNLRRVPFKVRVPRQTGGGSAGWTGEGKAKPLTSLAFDNVTLDFTKIASIAVLSDEIVRLSSPAAELLTRDSLADAIVQQLDADFIDPDNAGTANVKPASILNGVTPISSSGNAEANVRQDILAVFAPWIAANMRVTDGAWIMSSTTALALSLMVNGLGQPSFPDISPTGGTLWKLPVIVSDSAGVVNGSAGGHIVALVAQSAILLADDGTVAVDLSREASLEMSDAPSSSSATGTGASLVSMFQTNSVAIRAERWINWVKGRSAAAQYLRSVNWGEA